MAAQISVTAYIAFKIRSELRERPQRVYSVEKLAIEMTVSAQEFSMRLLFAAFDFPERVVLVPLRSSES